MSYDDDSERAHKTGRIAIVSIMFLLLGGLLFLYKTEACSSKPENCKDEFLEFDPSGRYGSNNHACSPGAVVEVVNSPPSPKPGVMCHCVSHSATPQAAPSK